VLPSRIEMIAPFMVPLGMSEGAPDAEASEAPNVRSAQPTTRREYRSSSTAR